VPKLIKIPLPRAAIPLPLIAVCISFGAPLLWAAPYTSSGSSYSTGTSSNGRGGGQFAVSLGNPSNTSTTFDVGGIGGSTSGSATPITCDIQSIMAGFDAHASLGNFKNGLQNFLKTSVKNYAVNEGMNAAAGAYALSHCTGAGSVEITAAVTHRMATEEILKNTAAFTENSGVDAARITANQGGVTAAQTPIIDPYKLMSGIAATAASTAARAAAVGQKNAVAYARVYREEYAVCYKDSKKQFYGYMQNAMQIMNGDFWGQIQLEAQQCQLEKNLTNSNPSAGWQKLLGTTNGKIVDLGLFSVTMSGSNVVIDSQNERQINIVEKTAYSTNETVKSVKKISEGRLMSLDEKARWDAFIVKWDNAMNAGKNKSAEIQKVFDEQEIRPEFKNDSTKADYWITFIYYQYLGDLAKNQEQDAKNHVASDIASSIPQEGTTQAMILATLKQMQATMLIQQRLLAESNQSNIVQSAQANKDTGSFVTGKDGKMQAVLPKSVTSSIEVNSTVRKKDAQMASEAIADIDLSAITD